jgi:pimeloyl-ACP methyl ester carboxylesterase
MTLVEVADGLDIHVQDVGDGPPVVLLAGFGLDHAVWDGQVRALGGEHRVVCIDLRGTGQSSKPYDDYGIDVLADDVERVLERLGLTGVALVGWSFGGQVAFRVAADSRRVSRLVLVASGGVRATRSVEFPFGASADQLERALIGAEISDRLAARAATIRRGFHEAPPQRVLDFLVGSSLRMPSWAAVASYRTYLHADLIDRIDDVTVPVLHIVGDEDPVHGLDGVGWLSERLTDSRVHVLPECGHYPMFEAPGAFDEALRPFVGG